jgi:hypothetical protein
MSDRDISKLIVVTQRDKRHRLDRGLAEMINDGLAMYEQELCLVGGASRWRRRPGLPALSSSVHVQDSAQAGGCRLASLAGRRAR